jgi:hypothetical protein
LCSTCYQQSQWKFNLQKKGEKMKKQILAALAFCALGAASAAFAAANRGDGVVGGPHDMSMYGYSDSQQRVCAFCHTPHHAASSTNPADYLPLWSRSTDTTPFNRAYASATINASELLMDTDKAIGPTRLCMSCHDGSIAPDQHYGNSGTAAPLTGDLFSASAGNGAGVGAGAAGLTNDHPVGFDYAAVAVGPSTDGVNPTAAQITAANNDANTDPWIRNPNALYKNNSFGITVADRLYVSGGKSYMTCATCHDVHNKKNVYTTTGTEAVNYLVLAPQANSALCLSCHIK